MTDYTKLLPVHIEKYLGAHDLFMEIFPGKPVQGATGKRPPLLFVHGAYTGSWMWSKYMPHFIAAGWTCYAMNLRGHYKSRHVDLTAVTFADYLTDLEEAISECGEPPILIGFSMGGILGQKLAENAELRGLVLIDSTICREAYEKVPYDILQQPITELIVPPPAREEAMSIDESPEDIDFQRKYLAMESARAFNAFMFTPQNKGISVNSAEIHCPCLVLKAVGEAGDDERGRALAEHYRGSYVGLAGTTHTGLLVGQRYIEAVEAILKWLERLG